MGWGSLCKFADVLPREPLGLRRPAGQAPMTRHIEDPDFRAAVLVSTLAALVHRHVEPPEAHVKCARLLRAGAPHTALRGAQQRPGWRDARLRAAEVDLVHLAEEGEERVTLARRNALYKYRIAVGVEERLGQAA